MDLLTLLKDRITSMLLKDESTHVIEKKQALEQFYPFLLTALKSKPEWIEAFQNNLNPRLTDIFAGHLELKDQFLAAVSQTAPQHEIELLLNRSIPPVLNVLEDEAGSRDPVVIEHFLNQKNDHVSIVLAPWAQAILGAIGLGGLATATTVGAQNINESVNTTIQPVNENIEAVVPPPSVTTSSEPIQTNIESEKKSTGGFWSALIALLILICLAFWGLRSCKNNDTEATAPIQANQESAQNDAILVVSTDKNGNLQSCQANIGDASFITTLQQQIKKIFNHAPGCVTGTQGFTANLTDQSALESVLQLIKGVPNVSLTWTGSQLTLTGTDVATLERLKGQIQPLLKTVNVQVAQSLDENAAVSTSIHQAQQAIAAINPDTAQPQDITKALNLQIINFASGSDVIPDVNKDVLNQAAVLMKSVENAKLVIKGYTDSVGNADSNKILSQKRAQAVADYLTTQGVDRTRLTVQGLGQENPIADNTTKEGQFKNRRIEFDVVAQ